MLKIEHTPLVSIIVITYNSSKYVLETLESTKEQTYQNIELIITDDCSTDDTVEVCKNWLAINKSRFINTELITVQNNTGIPANCNRGIRAMKGEWLKLIAGDDILLDSCISDNVHYINENSKATIVFSQVKTFSDNVNNGEIRPKNGSYFHSLEAEQQYKLLLIGDVISYTPSAFIQKKQIESLSFYDEKYTYIEDYPFWLKATKNNVKLHFFETVTVLYRIHSASIYHSLKANSKKSVTGKRLHFLQLRKDLVYPHYSQLKLYREQYADYLAFKFKNVNANSFSSFLYKLATLYLNPFIHVSLILKKIFRLKNIDFNF
ncbi:glycosyltransferase [Flavobacterium sp. PL11]|uniref:glycosyltransferase n=1 Tax=Flavobacterium sp. PL11 TaxID=3071717 RepID=UPI002E11728C